MNPLDLALRTLWGLWGLLIAVSALFALGAQGPQLLEAHRLPAAVETFRAHPGALFAALAALSLLRLARRDARRSIAPFTAALAASGAGLLMSPPLRLPADWAPMQALLAWLPLSAWEGALFPLAPPLHWRLREDGPEGGRVVTALFAAALLSWTFSSLGLAARADAESWALGASWSLLLHLLLAAAAAASWALARELVRWAGGGARAEAAALLSLLAAGAALLFHDAFCAPLAVRAPWAFCAALAAGAALASSWGGVCRACAKHPLPSGTAFLCAPLGRLSAPAAWGAVAGGGAAFWGLQLLLPGRDWGDLLRTLSAPALWAALAALAYASPLPRLRRPEWASLAVVPAAVLLLALRLSGGAAVSALERGLRAQELRDPSLRAARRLFARTAEDPLFAFLRARTNLPAGAPLHPRDPALVDVWKPFPSPLPHVFVFVIDSLRRDHVSAYPDARVRTPAFEAFSREEGAFAFDAFTQYGGTGLAQPSLWAGGVLPHRQPPAGFPEIDNLGRLLARAGYRRWLGLDVYLRRFLAQAPGDRLLDEGAVGDYRFCNTTRELAALLPQAAAGTPVFVYSRPEDLHIALRIRDGDRRAEGAERYAERVRGVDACFGRFVADLKRAGLWERSIVVLTADHGDLLGEDGLWGHADTLRPQVLRIPLVLRVPRAFSKELSPVRSPAFLTDLTPTLYALLGQSPLKGGPLRGRPLFLREGELDPGPGTRLLASSFSTVWGLLEEGRYLYIADALNAERSFYDLSADPGARRNLLTPPLDASRARDLRVLVERLMAEFRRT
ncbi:MAG: sulfatase-like hydrolase/transferase [Elusimicrobiota bacterium]